MFHHTQPVRDRLSSLHTRHLDLWRLLQPTDDTFVFLNSEKVTRKRQKIKEHHQEHKLVKNKGEFLRRLYFLNYRHLPPLHRTYNNRRRDAISRYPGSPRQL